MEHIIERKRQIAEQIFKSYKSDTDYLEKGGKRATIGEVREWGGEKWVKHQDGWVHVHPKTGKATLERPGGKRETASEEHVEHHKKSISGKETVDRSKDGFKVGDKVDSTNKQVYEEEEWKRNSDPIGKTSTGKLIYPAYLHPAHKGFTDLERKERDQAIGRYIDERSQKIQLKKIVGYTKSGKAIWEDNSKGGFSNPKHKNFTKQDHLDAVELYKKREKNARLNDEKNQKEHYQSTSYGATQSTYLWHHKMMAEKKAEEEEEGNNIMEEIGGEEKDPERYRKVFGEEVIGKTQSGKNIYNTHNHSSHKDFTSQDHEDAESLHGKLMTKYNKELQNKNNFSKEEGDSLLEKINHHKKQSHEHRDSSQSFTFKNF